MRKQITVDEAEINIAQRGVTIRCAIAAAIMSQVPSARYIKVTKSTIAWLDVDRRERLIFRTPPSAQVFIDNWDNDLMVGPFQFALTDSTLIERRAPRVQSTRARVRRPQSKPVQAPGSRMRRIPQDETCADPPTTQG